jgi:hypothetical protein
VCIGRQIYIDPNKPAPPQDVLPLKKPVAAKRDSRKSLVATPLPSPQLPTIPILADWYVGPWPLDIKQPLKAYPSLRSRPDSISKNAFFPPVGGNDEDENRRWTGIDYVTQVQGSPTTLAPAPFDSAMMKKKKMDEIKGEDGSTPRGGKTKKPRISKAGIGNTADEGSVSGSAKKPTVSGGGRGRGAGRVRGARVSVGQRVATPVQ